MRDKAKRTFPYRFTFRGVYYHSLAEWSAGFDVCASTAREYHHDGYTFDQILERFAPWHQRSAIHELPEAAHWGYLA